MELALKALGAEADLPKGLDGILTETGDLGPKYQELSAQASRWLDVALEVRDKAPKPWGESLAIPTWVYGSEPSTPFASAYAKYFQNSIREEALVKKFRIVRPNALFLKSGFAQQTRWETSLAGGGGQGRRARAQPATSARLGLDGRGGRRPPSLHNQRPAISCPSCARDRDLKGRTLFAARGAKRVEPGPKGAPL